MSGRGHRKFRFSSSKNYERKKYMSSLSFVVCVPLDLVSIYRVSVPLTLLSLKVHLYIYLFLQQLLQDLYHIYVHDRLSQDKWVKLGSGNRHSI